MPILTKTLIAAWENECHPKESPSLPRGRTLLPWRPKSTWIAGTKSTLAGPNYHLLGEQKIPGFLRRLYALISVHRESLQSQRIQCRPRHLLKRQLSGRERSQPNNARLTNNARITSVIDGARLKSSSIIISNRQSFHKYDLIFVI